MLLCVAIEFCVSRRQTHDETACRQTSAHDHVRVVVVRSDVVRNDALCSLDVLPSSTAQNVTKFIFYAKNMSPSQGDDPP
mmetsp:Transcript_6086/g.16197  ORF Transcript_6086/g.16197 Transcript_6086/m.16197 type:complete len:80 (+) Transcript_6086:163-402(+)